MCLISGSFLVKYINILFVIKPHFMFGRKNGVSELVQLQVATVFDNSIYSVLTIT